MLKKLLYILASFILGFILILNVIYSNFYSAFQYLSAEAVTNKEYTKAERFFSRALDENKFFSQEYNDGVYIEVFSALNDGVRYVYDEEGNKTETTYYTLESTIQFTLFHLTDSFSMEDKEDSFGGVELYFDNSNETVFVPFKTEEMDNYSLVTNYSFLVVNVNYDDYVSSLIEKGISADAQIVSARIYDSEKDDVYLLEFAANNRPTFNTEFHNAYTSVLAEYNANQLKAAKEGSSDKDVADEITAKYESITNEYGFTQQHGVGIVYGSFKFLFPVISSALAFLGVDILLGYLIFRKKRQRGYHAPSKKQVTEVKKRPEPEQFTRNVFNLEEDDVVVNNATEEKENNE